MQLAWGALKGAVKEFNEALLAESDEERDCEADRKEEIQHPVAQRETSSQGIDTSPQHKWNERSWENVEDNFKDTSCQSKRDDANQFSNPRRRALGESASKFSGLVGSVLPKTVKEIQSSLMTAVETRLFPSSQINLAEDANTSSLPTNVQIESECQLPNAEGTKVKSIFQETVSKPTQNINLSIDNQLDVFHASSPTEFVNSAMPVRSGATSLFHKDALRNSQDAPIESFTTSIKLETLTSSLRIGDLDDVPLDNMPNNFLRDSSDQLLASDFSAHLPSSLSNALAALHDQTDDVSLGSCTSPKNSFVLPPCKNKAGVAGASLTQRKTSASDSPFDPIESTWPLNSSTLQNDGQQNQTPRSEANKITKHASLPAGSTLRSEQQLGHLNDKDGMKDQQLCDVYLADSLVGKGRSRSISDVELIDVLETTHIRQSATTSREGLELEPIPSNPMEEEAAEIGPLEAYAEEQHENTFVVEEHHIPSCAIEQHLKVARAQDLATQSFEDLPVAIESPEGPLEELDDVPIVSETGSNVREALPCQSSLERGVAYDVGEFPLQEGLPSNDQYIHRLTENETILPEVQKDTLYSTEIANSLSIDLVQEGFKESHGQFSLVSSSLSSVSDVPVILSREEMTNTIHEGDELKMKKRLFKVSATDFDQGSCEIESSKVFEISSVQTDNPNLPTRTISPDLPDCEVVGPLDVQTDQEIECRLLGQHCFQSNDTLKPKSSEKLCSVVPSSVGRPSIESQNITADDVESDKVSFNDQSSIQGLPSTTFQIAWNEKKEVLLSHADASQSLKSIIQQASINSTADVEQLCLALLSSSIANLSIGKATPTEEIEQTMNEFQSQAMTIQALETKVENLQLHLNVVTEKAAETFQQYRVESEAQLEMTIRAHAEELSLYKSRYDTLMEQYKRQQQAGRELSQKHVGSETAQSTLKHTIEQLEMQNDDLSEQLESWQKAHAQISETHHRLNSEVLQDIEEEFEQSKVEFEHQKVLLNQFNGIDKKLKIKEIEVLQLQRDLLESREIVNRFNRLLEDINADHESAIGYLESRLSSLQRELTQTKEKLTFFSDQSVELDKAKMEVENLKKENMEAKESATSYQKHNEVLSDALKKVLGDLHLKIEESENLVDRRQIEAKVADYYKLLNAQGVVNAIGKTKDELIYVLCEACSLPSNFHRNYFNISETTEACVRRTRLIQTERSLEDDHEDNNRLDGTTNRRPISSMFLEFLESESAI